MMPKQIKYLIIHCSATPEGQPVTAAKIKGWHMDPPPRGRGWSRPGYSDLVLLDGTRHTFVKHDNDLWIEANEITNGSAGINSVSRHVCYIGGLDKYAKRAKDTLTEAQNAMLSSIIAEVLSYAPNVLIAGHNQFSQKDCPSFWVPTYLKEKCMISIPDKNIYTNDPYGYKN